VFITLDEPELGPSDEFVADVTLRSLDELGDVNLARSRRIAKLLDARRWAAGSAAPASPGRVP
jgi:hypothetical protein